MAAHYRYYLMAFILSVLVSISAFFTINQIDSSQVSALAKQVEQDSINAESARLSLQFIESLDGTAEKDAACLALIERTNQQVSQTYALLTALENAKRTISVADVSALRQKYFLSNAGLYLNFKKINSLCGQKSDLALYFYVSETPCPECEVQGRVLDKVRADCPAVKTFAFPTDNQIGLVELFKKTFEVTNAPFIVINEGKIFNGLVSEQELKKALNC